jgi:hypothetical protein
MKKILLLACAFSLLHPVQSHARVATSSMFAISIKSELGLSINFISKGAGIDTESFDKIEAFLKDHPKKPSYTVSSYGKEGEKMISVALNGLSKKEQKTLEKDIKKLIVKKDMVLVTKVKKIRAKY